MINVARRKLENDLRRVLDKIKEIAQYHNIPDTDIDYKKTLSAISGWYAEVILTSSNISEIVIPDSELLTYLEESKNGN